MQVEYRAYEPDDFEAISRIVGQTWCASADERAQQLAGAFVFATTMRRSTYSRIAVADGCVVGFVFARASELDEALDAQWQRVADAALAKLREHDARAAERTAVYAREEERIDAALLAESGCDERYEVVLFICAPEARGLGVGRALFDDAERYLACSGATEAFLYTDDGCTWGFYEHRGLRRAAEYRPTPDERDAYGLLDAYYLYVDGLA